MRYILGLICFYAFLVISTGIRAQSNVQISQPQLELKENTIRVSYRILQSSPDDLFRIWLEISDEEGNKLNAVSLSGDIGENVRGGEEKEILWHFENDIESLTGGIYVQLFGTRINSNQVPENASPLENERHANAITGNLIRSVAFPGWGLVRTNPGKPHWLKGVVGYGAIASALVFNRMAVASYDHYLDSDDITEFNDYFDQSIRQENISKISAYVAIGVWVTDLAWTLIGNSQKGNRQTNTLSHGFGFGAGYESTVQVPMVSISYTF